MEEASRFLQNVGLLNSPLSVAPPSLPLLRVPLHLAQSSPFSDHFVGAPFDALFSRSQGAGRSFRVFSPLFLVFPPFSFRFCSKTMRWPYRFLLLAFSSAWDVFQSCFERVFAYPRHVTELGFPSPRSSHPFAQLSLFLRAFLPRPTVASFAPHRAFSVPLSDPRSSRLHLSQRRDPCRRSSNVAFAQACAPAARNGAYSPPLPSPCLAPLRPPCDGPSLGTRARAPVPPSHVRLARRPPARAQRPAAERLGRSPGRETRSRPLLPRRRGRLERKRGPGMSIKLRCAPDRGAAPVAETPAGRGPAGSDAARERRPRWARGPRPLRSQPLDASHRRRGSAPRRQWRPGRASGLADGTRATDGLPGARTRRGRRTGGLPPRLPDCPPFLSPPPPSHLLPSSLSGSQRSDQAGPRDQDGRGGA